MVVALQLLCILNRKSNALPYFEDPCVCVCDVSLMVKVTRDNTGQQKRKQKGKSTKRKVLVSWIQFKTPSTTNCVADIINRVEGRC